MDDYFDNLEVTPEYPEDESDEVTATLAVKKDAKLKNEGHLTIDVFQIEDEIVVQSTIAGANPDDIDVSVTKDMITIRGKREPDHKTKPSDYFHQELYWGPFSRAVILPTDVDSDNARAAFKNGVLTITLPKLEVRKNKRLRLHSD